MKRAIIWCAVSSEAQASDDKVSLDDQKQEARAACERNDWQIIDTLILPGHSRSFFTLNDLAAAAALVGFDAPTRLKAHIEARDFDVLVTYNTDRLGREASLTSEIIGRVIRQCRAEIFSITEGRIDEVNFRGMSAIAGFTASSSVDALKRRRQMAMPGQARRGLPISGVTPATHVVIRDTMGRGQHVELDETKAQLWRNLATLILEGVAWGHIENELYHRFGHVDGAGRPYMAYYMYSLIFNPMTWGHICIGYKSPNRAHKKSRTIGLWVMDDTEPLPEGVEMHRNVVPPVFEGETAERIRAEVRRRSLAIRGHAKSGETQRYTGLFLCGRCGRYMSCYYNRNRRERGIRCGSAYRVQRGAPMCTEKRNIGIGYLNQYVNAVLVDFLNGVEPELFRVNQPRDVSAAEQLADVEADIAVLENQIERLIYEQSLQADRTQDYYRRIIQTTSERITIFQNEAIRLRAAASIEVGRDRDLTLAIEDIRRIGLENFWKLPDGEINRILHRIMGKRRFVMIDKKIKRLALAPRAGARRPSSEK